ncbi:hypothetical protein LZC95_10640 [Pendulispora brunnea]|uniref:Uncharacterized protein n=1 Tax=Pendulispora brunnea TaxID=2905690 RepID=A0ABZ2KF17_9BACT
MATTKKGGSKKAAAKGGEKPAGKAAGKSPAGKAAAAGKEDKAAGGKRKLGLRGAAPWAARHAAKHAAEARARAAEPPLPGSARATIRTPTGAEDIKQKIADLHNALQNIKGLRKNFNKSFYDIGIILKDIQGRKLYEAKGYGTFEAFLEREIDLGKITSLRLVRVVGVFIKEAALEHGVDRVLNALVALETATESSLDVNKGKVPPPPISTAALPLKPPGR